MKTTIKALAIFIVQVALSVFMYYKRVSYIKAAGIFDSDLLAFFVPIIISFFFYVCLFSMPIKSRATRFGLSFILAMGGSLVSMLINLNTWGS